jgi:hypothetical protein
MFNYMRSLNQPVDRMTVVLHDSTVSMAYSDGRTVSLQTDDKKVEERAENGLVKLKQKSHWDGQALVTDIEIDNGPKIERRYELSPGSTELHITQTVNGGMSGGGGRGRGGSGGQGGASAQAGQSTSGRRPGTLFVYERPLQQ